MITTIKEALDVPQPSSKWTVWDHPFSTYAKVSEKLTFLTS